jgi:hypothetical protein
VEDPLLGRAGGRAARLRFDLLLRAKARVATKIVK